jgi:hypothetical protein
MPPAALKPTLPSASRHTASSVAAASSVAPTSLLPVEVLRKSTPAITEARAAAVIRSGSRRVPVSRITLSVMLGPAAARQASISSPTRPTSPSRSELIGPTTSTSSAPAATAAAVSSATAAMSSPP